MEQEIIIPPGHFKCENCGGVFLKGWSDDEARAEALNNFGGLADENPALFCDGCYEKFLRWLGQQQ